MPVDYGRVHRLLEMISLMHSKQASNAKAFAERYGCAQRTIYRDLQILTDLGIPHYFDDQANGYRIRRDFFLPPVQLTAEEVLALTTLAEQVGKTEQVPFTAPAAKALEKLRGVLPEKVRKELGNLDEHIEVKLAATNDGTGIQDVFTVVSEAIRDKRALACKYESVTGDGGIDGIIKEDRLGLDLIYVQAKRYDSQPVGRPAVQAFAGALQGFRARKGVFLTTSNFTKDAQEFAGSIDAKIILIDGQQLARYMIDYNVGVAVSHSFEIKRIDLDFFDDE